jgi:hypothetical protein
VLTQIRIFENDWLRISAIVLFRPPAGMIPHSSPSYGAFSFPKLNGSPSRPAHMHSTSGTGTGFMGFGPTGFTTPIDTVLDRFGRTGTIFPSVNQHGNGMGVMQNNYGPPNGPAHLPGQPVSTAHRVLPSMVSRSNSLGRTLPPLPNKPPPLVRRRTFEDEDDRHMDWI